MDPNGTIRKDGSLFIVEVPWEAHFSSLSGMELVTTADGQIGRKVFRNKRIYLSHELEAARANHLTGHDRLIVGTNGYSSLSDAQCFAWGMRPGMYNAGVQKTIICGVNRAEETFRGTNFCFVHGAGPGSDEATIAAAKVLGRPHLGFNCPAFMPYVPDDEDPVYVAPTKETYASTFVSTLDVLLAFNGRAHAYDMDIEAVFKKHKFVIPVNIIRALSSNGGPPATRADGSIEDAVAFLEQRVLMVGEQMYGLSRSLDPWQATIDIVALRIGQVCRWSLSPARATAAH